ncbi:MAG: adaptor protein MecA [Clostridia bacterium]|nr:adaptor protein MecA [Clostridia bacterium]
MKINSPAEDKIIVDLSKNDMLELDITYEDMDYSTIETRRVIWTVLDEAGKILGRELDPSRRMIIEATPKNEGGCILSFTILDGKKKPFPQKHLLKKQSENIICDFENLDNLFRAAQEIKRFGSDAQSSLFESDGTYRLILNCTSEILKGILSEFCKVKSCGKLACDHTKEHWRLLASETAIENLLNS